MIPRGTVGQQKQQRQPKKAFEMEMMFRERDNLLTFASSPSVKNEHGGGPTAFVLRLSSDPLDQTKKNKLDSLKDMVTSKMTFLEDPDETFAISSFAAVPKSDQSVLSFLTQQTLSDVNANEVHKLDTIKVQRTEPKTLADTILALNGGRVLQKKTWTARVANWLNSIFPDVQTSFLRGENGWGLRITVDASVGVAMLLQLGATTRRLRPRAERFNFDRQEDDNIGGIVVVMIIVSLITMFLSLMYLGYLSEQSAIIDAHVRGNRDNRDLGMDIRERVQYEMAHFHVPGDEGAVLRRGGIIFQVFFERLIRDVPPSRLETLPLEERSRIVARHIRRAIREVMEAPDAQGVVVDEPDVHGALPPLAQATARGGDMAEITPEATVLPDDLGAAEDPRVEPRALAAEVVEEENGDHPVATPIENARRLGSRLDPPP